MHNIDNLFLDQPFAELNKGDRQLIEHNFHLYFCDNLQLHALKTLKNVYSEPATMKVSITRGMSAEKTSSAGGSTSVTVSAEVAFDVLKALSATIGVSGTTGYDWNDSTTSNSFEQVTHEISVSVKAGDEVTVYQVIGNCKNTDGTTYTVKSPHYVTKGKDGEIQSNNDLP